MSRRGALRERNHRPYREPTSSSLCAEPAQRHIYISTPEAIKQTHYRRTWLGHEPLALLRGNGRERAITNTSCARQRSARCSCLRTNLDDATRQLGGLSCSRHGGQVAERARAPVTSQETTFLAEPQEYNSDKGTVSCRQTIGIKEAKSKILCNPLGQPGSGKWLPGNGNTVLIMTGLGPFSGLPRFSRAGAPTRQPSTPRHASCPNFTEWSTGDER